MAKYRLTYNPMDAKSFGHKKETKTYEFDSSDFSPSAIMCHWIGANKRIERVS